VKTLAVLGSLTLLLIGCKGSKAPCADRLVDFDLLEASVIEALTTNGYTFVERGERTLIDNSDSRTPLRGFQGRQALIFEPPSTGTGNYGMIIMRTLYNLPTVGKAQIRGSGNDTFGHHVQYQHGATHGLISAGFHREEDRITIHLVLIEHIVDLEERPV